MNRFIAHCRKNKNGELVRKQRKEDGYMIEQIVAYNKKFVEEVLVQLKGGKEIHERLE